MNKTVTRIVIAGAIAVIAAGGMAAVASAQDRSTPKGWNYEIRDGKRVPKGNRVQKDDGSWREEIRQGNCITVKEKTAQGEYRETRQCNPRPS